MKRKMWQCRCGYLNHWLSKKCQAEMCSRLRVGRYKWNGWSRK